MNLKELCQRLQIKPALARALLAEGLIPGRKIKGVWDIQTDCLAQVEQAFQLLRTIPEPPAPAAPGAPADKDGCPNCHEPGFGPSSGGGWGEFFECNSCGFSIHQHNMELEALVSKAIWEHRRRLATAPRA